MSDYSTTAILLRRIEYGDLDFILSFFTREKGKVSVIAKAARKSQKRFGGALELFSIIDIAVAPGRKKGLPVLQEASIRHPFFAIRSNMKKMAYASYWAEIVNLWMEEGIPNLPLYQLLAHVLEGLEDPKSDEAALSILFQTRFMAQAGFKPNLRQCCRCRREVADAELTVFHAAMSQGGIICGACSRGDGGGGISKSTLKQLQWINSGDLKKAGRIRFSPRALKEGLAFMEAFVPYHIGREPKSLSFLRQIRRGPR